MRTFSQTDASIKRVDFLEKTHQFFRLKASFCAKSNNFSLIIDDRRYIKLQQLFLFSVHHLANFASLRLLKSFKDFK